jgi:hypothetical protein
MENPSPPLPNSSSPNPPQRRNFSKQEDEALRELVRLHGDKDWRKIAANFPGRSLRQCRDRYKNYLSGTSPSLPWTFQEERLLIEKFREFGFNWVKVATAFPNRDNSDVRNRWTTIVTRESKRWAFPGVGPILYGMPNCPVAISIQKNPQSSLPKNLEPERTEEEEPISGYGDSHEYDNLYDADPYEL